MKVKRFLAYCLVVFFTVLCGCSCASNNSASASYIAGDDLTNQSFVHWIGRTEYSSTEEKVYTYYSATGFTVDFVGTELYVTYHATNTNSNKNTHIKINIYKYFLYSLIQTLNINIEDNILSHRLNTNTD